MRCAMLVGSFHASLYVVLAHVPQCPQIGARALSCRLSYQRWRTVCAVGLAEYWTHVASPSYSVCDEKG
jgi:hypothetical protein